MRRVFATGLLIGMLAGCGGSEGSVDPTRLEGRYTLRTVNGRGLPFLVSESPGRRTEIVSGVLVIGPSTYSIVTESRDIENGVSTPFVVTGQGAYQLDGRSLITSGSLGGYVVLGTWNGDRQVTMRGTWTTIYVRE